MEKAQHQHLRSRVPSGWAVVLAFFLAWAAPLAAQDFRTVSEARFRSGWADYGVDQEQGPPQFATEVPEQVESPDTAGEGFGEEGLPMDLEDVADPLLFLEEPDWANSAAMGAPDVPDEDAVPWTKRLDEFFKDGPLTFTFRLEAGWEFSDYEEPEEETEPAAQPEPAHVAATPPPAPEPVLDEQGNPLPVQPPAAAPPPEPVVETVTRKKKVRERTNNSFFLAPAILIGYVHPGDHLDIMGSYSAGYKYFLDENYAPRDGGDENFTQSAILRLILTGGKVEGTSETRASYGEGFDFDANQTVLRTQLMEALEATLRLSEKFKLGTNLLYNITHQQYDLEGEPFDQEETVTIIDGVETVEPAEEALSSPDSLNDDLTASLFVGYEYSEKTEFRLEVGGGYDRQKVDGESELTRTFTQYLAKMLYHPTDKTAVELGLGWSTRSTDFEEFTTALDAVEEPEPVPEVDPLTGLPVESAAMEEEDPLPLHAEDSSGPVYTVVLSYAPTEKITITGVASLQGINRENTFSLGVDWHPREGFSAQVTGYRRTSLSASRVAEERTSTGVLASVKKDFFSGKVELSLEGGWEMAEYQSVVLATPEEDNSAEQYAYAGLLATWNISRHMALDASVKYSNRTRDETETLTVDTAGDGPETRAVLSLRLTY